MVNDCGSIRSNYTNETPLLRKRPMNIIAVARQLDTAIANKNKPKNLE